MRVLKQLLALLIMTILLITCAEAETATRALLVACSDFLTQEDLGAATSGNLHMVGSALISAKIPLGDLSIEDGTIGTIEALGAAIDDAFSAADEDDLSVLYLCTHGVLSSSDDEQVYLLLGDGQQESPMSSQQLYDLISGIQGDKLLILDSCFSGALIGRGAPDIGRLPGSHPTPPSFVSPFLLDASVHVLTSANGSESSWYYDSKGLSSGAVSYFASALSSGLGLYGSVEADLSGDGMVTLQELHRYLSIAVPSSSSQLLSTRAGSLTLPAAQGAMLHRPLMGFSYGTSLLLADDPTLDFSFTVTQENTRVQYRLIDYINGSWDWDNARLFLDGGDSEDSQLSVGRKMRSLSLEGLAPDEGGYLMLQVFSVYENKIMLCSERLIAVQPASAAAQLSLRCPDTLNHPGFEELPVDIHLEVPAELTVSVYDEQGNLVRRLASSQLSRPTPDNLSHLYWDGRDAQGSAVSSGTYTIAAEARVASRRLKAAAQVYVGAQR